MLPKWKVSGNNVQNEEARNLGKTTVLETPWRRKARMSSSQSGVGIPLNRDPFVMGQSEEVMRKS